MLLANDNLKLLDNATFHKKIGSNSMQIPRVSILGVAVMLAGCAETGPAPQAEGTHRLVTMAPAEGGAGTTAGLDLNALSRDDLRGCMTRKLQMQTDAVTLRKDKGAIEARRQVVQSEEAQVEAQRAGVNSHNAHSVDAFNQMVRKTMADSNAFNVQVNESNGRVAASNAAIADFDMHCGGRTYYQDDFDAISKEFPDLELTQ